MSHDLLSAEMKAAADALRSVRDQIVRMVAEGRLPVGTWPDASTVLVLGLDVANALDRLANGSEPARRVPSPYDPDLRM